MNRGRLPAHIGDPHGPVARPRHMIENSTHGLLLLDPDQEVTVTREEHHQPALAAYAPRADGRPRRVAVELAFCWITHGTHAGQRGIEVRLGGQRVGELTPPMAQRYGPLLDDVLARGARRPGGVAHVRHGRRGIEVELRLPLVAGPTPARPAPRHPHPGGRRREPVPAPPRRRTARPYLIGAGAVTALLLVVGLSAGRGDPTPTIAAARPTSSADPAPVTPPATARATTDAPAEVAAARPAPRTDQARPTTTAPERTPQPAPRPAPVLQAAPAPVPAGNCDPNYSGCVPVASDVDCAGGSGNGPAYVRGPVTVIGVDIYGLDSDKDGVGCES